MPRIKRWFHVSHDINSDPEIWELTERFGDRGLRAWLEILSIADRNNGLIPLNGSGLIKVFSIKLNTFQVKTKNILSWFEERTWLVRDPHLRVRNYSEYNKVGERKKFPSEPPYPNLPILRSPIVPKGDNGFVEYFWNPYPQKTGKKLCLKIWIKLHPDQALKETIRDAVIKNRKTNPKWQPDKDGKVYIPNPATWLNQGRWDDEVDDFIGRTRRMMPD